jgi:hypothetical protein
VQTSGLSPESIIRQAGQKLTISSDSTQSFPGCAGSLAANGSSFGCISAVLKDVQDSLLYYDHFSISILTFDPMHPFSESDVVDMPDQPKGCSRLVQRQEPGRLSWLGPGWESAFLKMWREVKYYVG